MRHAIGEIVEGIVGYLFPWNSVLVAAYIVLYLGTRSEDVRLLRALQALASLLFVVFGILAALWPMVGFNLVILATHTLRLADGRHPALLTAVEDPPVELFRIWPTDPRAPRIDHPGQDPPRLPLVVGELSTVVAGWRDGANGAGQAERDAPSGGDALDELGS